MLDRPKWSVACNRFAKTLVPHPHNKLRAEWRRVVDVSVFGVTHLFIWVFPYSLGKVNHYFCLFLPPGHQCATPGCHPKQGIGSLHLKFVSIGKRKQCLVASFGLTWLWSNPARFTNYTSLSLDFNDLFPYENTNLTVNFLTLHVRPIT